MGWSRTDDFDGTTGATQVVFGFEGKTYSIDLAPENHAAFMETMNLYVQHAQVIGAHHFDPEATAFEVPSSADMSTVLDHLEERVEKLAPRAQRRQKTRGKRTPTPVNTPAIRHWAMQEGLSVTARGRIPAAVMAAYRDAFPDGA